MDEKTPLHSPALDLTKGGEFILPDIDPQKEQLPFGVLSPEAYYQYRRLKAHPLLNERKFYMASDETEVNLCLAIFQIRPLVGKLQIPDSEKKYILEYNELARRITARLGQLKSKAFGSTGKGNLVSQLDTKREEILDLFGKFYTLEEVYRKLHTEWDIETSKFTLGKYREQFIEEITRRQERYKKDFADIRLGWKRGRLDELSYLYRTRKELYEKTKNKEDYKLLLLTIDQIRKEVEGDRLTIDGNVEVNINHTLQVKVREELMKEFSLKELIISKVANKGHINPLWILYKLQSSFYRKYNGIGGTGRNPTLEEEDQMVWPSALPFEWTEVQKLHEKNNLEEIKVISKLAEPIGMTFTLPSPVASHLSLKDPSVEEMPEDTVDLAVSKKQILLQLISSKKIELSLLDRKTDKEKL